MMPNEKVDPKSNLYGLYWWSTLAAMVGLVSCSEATS